MDRFLSFRLPLTEVTKEALLFSFGNCLYCGQAALWKFVTCNCFPLGFRPFIPYRGPQVLLGGLVGQPVGDSASLLVSALGKPQLPQMLPQPLWPPDFQWLQSESTPCSLHLSQAVRASAHTAVWQDLGIVWQLCHTCSESSCGCQYSALSADNLPAGSLSTVMA